ncbi:hypothetical protein AOQ88_01245 [Candidatus Riesia sp. GBBU]|nr:hypothetical protein AOQ88_01245 [Candidatus Riesia sp. GBBU]
MKKFFLILIFIIKIVNADTKNYFIVKKMIFSGLNHISNSTLAKIIPIRIGEKFIGNTSKKIVKTLSDTGLFENINIFMEKNILTIKVREKPIIKSIKFFGKTVLANDLLYKKLIDNNLKIGLPFEENKLENFKKSLKKYYYKIDRYRSNFTYSTEIDKNNKVSINIFLSDGEETINKQLNIIGNKSFSDEEIKEYLKINRKNNQKKFFHTSKFKKEDLIRDLFLIRDFYLRRGYIKFDINSVNISFTPDKKYSYLTINVSEGNQFLIKDVLLTCKKNKYSNRIKKLISIKKNSFYNFEEALYIKEKIKNSLEEHGYIDTNIEIYHTVDEKEHKISLNFLVDIGKKIYVRKILFKGNKISKNYILYREIPNMEGLKINTKLLKKSKEELYKTGLFEKIDIEILKLKNLHDTVDILFKLKEKNTGSINFGFGLEGRKNINFNVGIQQKNLFGTGNKIEFFSKKSNFLKTAEIFFENPFFFSRNIFLNSKLLYYSEHKQLENLRKDNKVFSIINNIGFSFLKNNIIKLGLEFKKYSFFDEINLDTLKYLEKSYKNFSYKDLVIHLNIRSNSLNNKVFPTCGKDTEINSKVTVPISNNQYYKIQFSNSYYYKVHREKLWIIMHKIKLGYGNGKKELPQYENFYSGGFSTIRGFKMNSIGPRIIYFKKNMSENYLKDKEKFYETIGGNSFIVSSLELIIPTSFLGKFSNLIRTSIFVDSGIVWNSLLSMNNEPLKDRIIINESPGNIRVSSGISIQWISPIGPLTISYSSPIRSYQWDKIEKFQFNFGRQW